MKNRIYGNRGKPLEEYINFANWRYQHARVAMVQKIPTEFIPLRNASGNIVSVKVEKKSTVDYIGRYKEHPLAMEAKSTTTDHISFDEVQPHQAAFLDEFTSQPGTIGLVLVSFKLETFFAIPWAFWGAAYDLRIRKGDRKTPKQVSAFGEEWIIPQKKSVRIEELNPKWLVSGRDTTFGLNYLQNAQNYII